MPNLTLVVESLESGLSETANQRISAVLTDLIQGHKSELAQSFYSVMMRDSAAAPYLEMQSVEDQLKPGLQRWLQNLFCYRNTEELLAVLAMQRHVGTVHARANIPVNLVARGMRVLKRDIIGLLQVTDLPRDELIAAVLRTDRLIDIAFEEMSKAFVDSHASSVRVDESYRMFAVGHNLALEREKQLGALLDWENRLFRAVATDQSFHNLVTISDSALGLWLHHKAP